MILDTTKTPKTDEAVLDNWVEAPRDPFSSPKGGCRGGDRDAQGGRPGLELCPSLNFRKTPHGPGDSTPETLSKSLSARFIIVIINIL